MGVLSRNTDEAREGAREGVPGIRDPAREAEGGDNDSFETGGKMDQPNSAVRIAVSDGCVSGGKLVEALGGTVSSCGVEGSRMPVNRVDGNDTELMIDTNNCT